MNRSYDDFMKDANPKVQSLMDSLRKFCFSLGNNVTKSKNYWMKWIKI